MIIIGNHLNPHTNIEKNSRFLICGVCTDPDSLLVGCESYAQPESVCWESSEEVKVLRGPRGPHIFG